MAMTENTKILNLPDLHSSLLRRDLGTVAGILGESACRKVHQMDVPT